ncbi:TPA: Slam-dependent surface lipoprotein [Mannheimia haemolytica]
MKIVKLGFSVLACSIIAACSSGGGSGSQSSASEISNPTVNKVNTSPSSPSVPPTATNSSHTGRVFVIKSVGMNDISITDVKLTNSDLTKISVEGKEIQIVYPGIFAKKWSDMEVGDTQLLACCGEYSDTRFGAYEGGPNGNAYLFHNGNPTKEMPSSGRATYNGHVIVAGDTPHFEDDDYLKGTSQFTADFSNKTLSGTLNVDTMQAINVNANISSNNFTGTASSGDFSTSAKVEGKFYGDNAKELSGVFHDSKTWGGAFGAAKAQ